MSWQDVTAKLLSAEVGAGTVSIILVIAGLNLIRRIEQGSPLSPYVLPILGLTFVLPIVLMVSLLLDVGKEFVAGIIGTIVGYIFGTTQDNKLVSQKPAENPSQKPT